MSSNIESFYLLVFQEMLSCMLSLINQIPFQTRNNVLEH